MALAAARSAFLSVGGPTLSDDLLSSGFHQCHVAMLGVGQAPTLNLGLPRIGASHSEALPSPVVYGVQASEATCLATCGRRDAVGVLSIGQDLTLLVADTEVDLLAREASSWLVGA